MRHMGDAVHITDVLAKVLGRDYLMSDSPDELAAGQDLFPCFQGCLHRGVQVSAESVHSSRFSARHPIVKELVCAVVIALFSQGIETIRDRHMRRQVGPPDQDSWP